jgi:hypothetical protein
MVLDAKTIFIRNVDLDELLDDQGRAKTGTMQIYSVFEPSRQIVNQTYDIDLQEQLGPGGVPFMFHNNTVRSMISDTTTKWNINFPEWFQRKGMLTEFMLYSGYVLKYKGYDALYTNNTSWKPVNLAHYEVDQFEQKLKMMNDLLTLTVSIHREAWKNLDSVQQEQYRQFLINKNLVEAEYI